MFLIYAGTIFSLYADWSHSYESRSSRCHIFSKQQARYWLVKLNFVIFQCPDTSRNNFWFGYFRCFLAWIYLLWSSSFVCCSNWSFKDIQVNWWLWLSFLYSCLHFLDAQYSYDRERNIPEHVARVAPWFQDGLKAFAKISPIIGEV